MTVFGIGTLELILILLILILVFGPDRITEMGRWLGQAYRKLTGLTSEVNQQVMEVRRTMDAELDTSSLTNSIREAAAEVESIQRDVGKTVSESTAELDTLQTDVESAVTETREQISQSIEIPPDKPEPHAQGPADGTEDNDQRDDDP